MQLSNHEPVETSTPNPKEIPGLCSCAFDEFPRFSVGWHRRHMAHHLAVFPDVDQGTRDNLAMFIDMAEERESTDQ